MSTHAALEVLVTEQGLVVAPEDLGKIGAHPGDRVVVNLHRQVRVRSMMGVGRRSSAPLFDDSDLREIGREMGDGLGDDLGR